MNVSGSSSSRISFYVGNHQSTLGIGDWVREVSRTFQALGLGFDVSNQYRAGAINLVLEEFADPDEVEAVLRAKATGAAVWLLMSEFISNTPNGLALNSFDIGLPAWGAILRRPVKSLSELREVRLRRGYLSARLEGLHRLKAESAVDAVLIGHPQMRESVEDFFLPSMPDVIDIAPELGSVVSALRSPCPVGTAEPQEFLDDLQPTQLSSWRYTCPIVVQGFVTPYRRRQIAQLQRRLRTDPKSFAGPLVRAVKPQDIVGFAWEYGAFDLMIPRSETWPYLSPFRILRSLRLGLIPVAMSQWASADSSAWAGAVMRVDSEQGLRELRTRLKADPKSVRDELALGIEGVARSLPLSCLGELVAGLRSGLTQSSNTTSHKIRVIPEPADWGHNRGQ